MNLDIDRCISELNHTISVARYNYEIWHIYTSEDTRPAYVKTMNRYSLFFQTSLHAHFVASLVALYRLYETRRDTFNVPSLLKALQNEQRLSCDTLEVLGGIYRDEVKPLWIKVNILRNKAFAHRSSDCSVNEVFREAEVTPHELRSLMEATEKLLAQLMYAWNTTVRVSNLSPREATFRLLNDLKGLSES